VNLDTLLNAALDEDLGPGDLATESTVPFEAAGRAEIVAKQDLVVSGQGAAARVLELAATRCGGSVVVQVVVADGASAVSGQVIALVSGSMRGMLVGERPALNLMMRMSGIATWTRHHVEAAAGGALRVVDTRKTTPLWRGLEKQAVRHGGAHNHRFGLFDGCMLKDNHIAAVGSITEAVGRARASIHHLVRIQVECATVADVVEAIAAGADSVMFDNMDDAQLKAAIAAARQADPRVVLEASGNMDAGRIARIRDFGLDVVSVGGLIHQARWVDLSMKVRT
jgi:nicotinate-nucleotide pyrophosphorylase (carboxylating)